MSVLNNLVHQAKTKPTELLLAKHWVDDCAEDIVRRYHRGGLYTETLVNYVRNNLLLGRVKLLGVPIRVVE